MSQSRNLSAAPAPSILNRNFILVTLSGFIFFFNFHSFLLLPLRIKELGGGESDIGFIMGATGFSTIFTTPAVGVLVDRFGRKPFLAAGGLLMSLTTLPFAFVDSLNFWFPLLRIVHGAAFSLCFISAGTLTADAAPPEKRSQALGLFGVFTIINYAIAPFAGRRIIEAWDFNTFFLCVFIFGFISFLVALFIREKPPEARGNYGEGGILSTLFRPGVFAAAFTLMVSGSGFIAALTFMPVFAKELNIASFDLFFLTYTASALAVRIFGGWIPDRFGKKAAAAPALLFFSLSVISLGFASTEWHLIASGVIFGLSHGFVYPSVYALVIDLSPVRDRGKAFAVCSVSFTFGGMIGSFAYGLVAEHEGFYAMYKLMGAVCLIGFFAFAIFGRSEKYKAGG
ncbi:MAG: MFS transporter [Deltaproteobacteria bacterium]